MLDRKEQMSWATKIVYFYRILLEIDFVCANAEELPFEANTFDAYTIAFGIRNVPRIPLAVKEAYRVLK